tara:strand:+ start:2295 stop:4661 length:2367 start_codon:yes stop_codon:yes gene_type:complete
MIKCISKIHKLAVFSGFSWEASVLDGDKRPVYCKQLNIIYGRNYTGKTTLSRIVRSLETGHLSDRYIDPNFEVEFTDNISATQGDMTSHGQEIRVFNEDYVRENLKVFQQDDEDIAAFAVLGQENKTLAESLEAKEAALGDEDVPGSLKAIENDKRQAKAEASNKLREDQDSINTHLRNEARKTRENHSYNNINYDIRNIRDDVDSICNDNYTELSEEDVAEHKSTLSESSRDVVPACPTNGLRLSMLATNAVEVLETKVLPSEPIQDLLNNAILQEWVRKGRTLHDGERKNCGFCGNTLPSDLWSKLDNHFNKESEDLRSKITRTINDIDSEHKRVNPLLHFESGTFYATKDDDFSELQAERDRLVKEYQSSLDQLRDSLNHRLKDIFTAIEPPRVKDPSDELDQLRNRYETLIDQTNTQSSNLTEDQKKSRVALRLHQISLFLKSIGYENMVATIEKLKEEHEAAEQVAKDAAEKTKAAQIEIAIIKSKMRDERNGAEKVNEYLRHHFGHPLLSLHAVANEEEDGDAASYRFEIRRGNERAYHLSEGERGLLAFCYFMARLEDVETSGAKPIVWIDDPISSLDENHIYFVYSIIRTQIIEKHASSQLFISTHSLAFLKYLKRVAGREDLGRSYFLLDRSESGSTIKQMPKHLKNYATEFHYLFHCIYRCANSAGDENADHYYGFGNNARKFLEMYLYFKYPDASKATGLDTSKLSKFLGDDAVATTVGDRIANEYSHLSGLFERGMTPVDTAAMKPMAQLILDKIKEHDEDQYKALVNSIGETPMA